MGHDFITYGQRHVHMKDLDIWTLRQLLYREACEVGSDDLGDGATLDALRTWLASWEWIGPGVVTGTELADFVQQQPQRQQALAALLRRTRDRLQDWAPQIPLDFLKEHVNTPQVSFVVPLPTDRFIKKISAILQLLE